MHEEYDVDFLFEKYEINAKVKFSTTKFNKIYLHFAFAPGRGGSRRRGLHKNIPAMHMNLKFKYENNFKIKNKLYPGISTTYYPSKKTIERPFFLITSRETIPLKATFLRGS
jgi:hypothetical protein